MPRLPVDFGQDHIGILGGSVSINHSDLLERAHLQADDIFIVSGTLIEGIGNIHSDLDCIVICRRHPEITQGISSCHTMLSDESYIPNQTTGVINNTYDYLGQDGLHIDIDYITFEDVNILIQRVSAAYIHCSTDQRILYHDLILSHDSRIIHRIATGHALRNVPRFEAIRRLIPLEQFCYVLSRQAYPSYFVFKDVQGAWSAGDYWMARELARNICIDGTQALCHSHMITNPNKKWLFTLTDNVPFLRGILSTEFKKMLSRGAQTEVSCRENTLSMLEYFEEVTRAIHLALLKSSTYPTSEAGLLALQSEFKERRNLDHPLSKGEWDYRIKLFSPDGARTFKDMVLHWAL